MPGTAANNTDKQIKSLPVGCNNRIGRDFKLQVFIFIKTVIFGVENR